MTISIRPILLSVVVSIAGILGFAYYSQYVNYLDPCPLCITQRFFYFLIGVAALIALLAAKSSGWRKTTALLMGVFSLTGLGTAARQVWLQHLPPEKVPECGPGLHYWLENMPFLTTLELLFKGDGNCAEVDWLFLGLSMAGWSIILFSMYLLVSLCLFTGLGLNTTLSGQVQKIPKE